LNLWALKLGYWLNLLGPVSFDLKTCRVDFFQPGEKKWRRFFFHCWMGLACGRQVALDLTLAHWILTLGDEEWAQDFYRVVLLLLLSVGFAGLSWGYVSVVMVDEATQVVVINGLLKHLAVTMPTDSPPGNQIFPNLPHPLPFY
jgi:hypothetical protein